jgi:hypothetical protein
VPRLTVTNLRTSPNSEAEGAEIVETNTCTKHTPKIRIEQHSFTGGLWCAAWLFTIGFLHLSFWKGVFAIVLWPYYIGVHVSSLKW